MSEYSVTITQYGGKTPCVIVRKGEDPEPTCVNPNCPRQLGCKRHILNRKDQRTPSIAIIAYHECDYYEKKETATKSNEL